MEKENLKTEDNIGMNQKQIKKLINVGYISCFLFLVLFILFSSIESWYLSGATICGIVYWGFLFGSIQLFIFAVPLLIIFLLVCVRIKYRKRKDLFKGLGVGKSSVSMILLFVVEVFFILIVFTSGGVSRSRAILAAIKSSLDSTGSQLTMYHDKNNRYPRNLEELGVNLDFNEYATGKYYNDIVVKNEGSANDFYINVDLYGIENRFPCESKKVIMETIKYHCDYQSNCGFE